MNNSKLLLLLSLGFFLASCGSIAKLAVPSGIDNSVNISGKKSKLTEGQLQMWVHTDLATDSIPGMSVDKAHEFLKGKKSTTVIVAIADSGIDINHSDLKGNVWNNPKEVAGNGIDDDKNGFVDDMHGWNFLGSSYDETLEITRIVRNYRQRFGSKTATQIDAKDMVDFKEYIKLKEIVGKEAAKDRGDHYYDIDFNPRAKFDANAYNYNVKIYGDNKVNNVIEDEAHGSHVAGIVAADRTNSVGARGVANNVKIMSIRMVPNGDEYDKDVALAIRYAADNGAKVINTSFGKGYSPNVGWVHDAIKYAAKKDVLIVNAAGNSAENVDVTETYPNDTPNNIKEVADNMLTIGALAPVYNERLAASFSNYGKRNVDIFAPGVVVYSTMPNENYALLSGTSMASPSTAGVAALIRSYYPELSAKQVKHIIMNSGTKVNMDVLRPGSKTEKIPFSSMSVTGRIVNAYNAVVMADKMVNKK